MMNLIHFSVIGINVVADWCRVAASNFVFLCRWEAPCTTPGSMCPCGQTKPTWWTSPGARWGTATGWRRSASISGVRTPRVQSTSSMDKDFLGRWAIRERQLTLYSKQHLLCTHVHGTADTIVKKKISTTEQSVPNGRENNGWWQLETKGGSLWLIKNAYAFRWTHTCNFEPTHQAESGTCNTITEWIILKQSSLI